MSGKGVLRGIGAGLVIVICAGSGFAASEPGAFEKGRLGMTEAELRAAYGTALRAQKIEEQSSPIPARLTLPRRAKTPGAAPGQGAAPKPAAADPYANQQGFLRAIGGGDVVAAEYLLYKGRVYRIRWALADRFEQPIMAELVQQGTKRFGEPAYDQNIVRKPGSPKANLWRTAWERGARTLEIRQLNPIMGGPVYVTLSDEAAIKAIVRAGGIVAPEPESAGSWWLTKQRKPRLLTPEEREALESAFWKIAGRSGF